MPPVRLLSTAYLRSISRDGFAKVHWRAECPAGVDARAYALRHNVTVKTETMMADTSDRNEGNARNDEPTYSGAAGERERDTPGRTPRQLGLDPEEIQGHSVVGDSPGGSVLIPNIAAHLLAGLGVRWADQ